MLSRLTSYKSVFLGFAAVTILASCDPEKKETVPVAADSVIVKNLLSDFTTIVARPNYQAMAVNGAKLKEVVYKLNANLTQANLDSTRIVWRAMRENWEQTESFLFGPVANDNIDPGIDTWPVNKNDLDSLLGNSQPLTQAYVAGQQESLKGFHPLEYLLFGANGTKTPAEFTAREREYMVSLADYLAERSATLWNGWNPANSSNYGNVVIAAGSAADSTYPTRYAAVEELIGSMAGIAGEVGEAKIGEPFQAGRPELEESPFSKNSMTDFKNNIIGVRNVYTGNYGGKTGTSLSTFVAKYNRDLDIRIKAKIESSIQALSNVTVSFGEAITTQTSQLQNAQTELDGLKDLLEGELSTLAKNKLENK
ncbi:MAG: imelysin family protein [Bacteroidota bacterium]